MTSTKNCKPDEYAMNSKTQGTEAESGGIADIYTSALLAASPDGIKLIDLDGTIRSVNAAALQLMEADDKESPVGRGFADTFPEESAGAALQALGDAASGQSSRFTAFRSTVHGTPKWWDIVVSPVADAAGKLVCLMSVSRDITRLMATEASLRDEERRFRALADNIDQLAWMADASGALFWYNRRWFDYTGTTLEQVAGDGWKCVHHPDHLQRVTEKYQGCVSKGEAWEDTFPLRGSDGSYRWFLSRARPIFGSGGNVVLWCGTNTDVTDQRNSSARLRQLARLIELSHEATIVWDTQGGILLWNRGCEELYGYTQAEAIGMSSHKLLHTVHPVTTAEFDENLVRDGAWSGELLHTAKNGAKVWVDSRQELIRVAGRNVVLETNRDITERRRADEVRNLLVAEINHRVKNMLAIVQSVAAQTARNSASPQQFVAAFNGRLQALSCAHNVLTEAHWVGAGLRQLILSQLQITGVDAARITCESPDVFLPPQVALQMTLMVHELATNAVRHGSLTSPAGKIDISWVVKRDPKPILYLTWREQGGSPVTPPAARGFGTTLIERSGNLPHLKSALSFELDGVVCQITADLEFGAEGELGYFNPGKHLQECSSAAKPAAGFVDRARLKERRVLVVEADPVVAMELEEILADAGFGTVGAVRTTGDAIKALTGRTVYDVALLDRGLCSDEDPIVDCLKTHNVPLVFLARDGQHSQLPALTVSKPVDPTWLVRCVVSHLKTDGDPVDGCAGQEAQAAAQATSERRS